MRWLMSDSLALAGRNLAHVRQIPEKLLDVTFQPVVFVLLFAYVFGGVIAVPGGSYREYLVAGVIVQTLTFGLMGPGVSIATDLREGFVDRFRSLPSSRWSYLLGHLVAELAASLLALTVLVATGLVVGWTIHTDVWHVLAAFGLLGLFSTAMILIGTLVGMQARSPDAVAGIAFMTVLPATFLANAFVPTAGLPDGLRQIAEYNPISAIVAAVRTLFGNPTAIAAHAPWPLEHPVIAAFGWSLILLAIAAPLCVARFKARTTD